MRKLLVTVVATLAITLNLCADLTLPTIFTDHMVLQRGQTVPVWGTAEPDSKITVEFAEQKKSATADADGKWRIDLDPMKADAKPQTMTVISSTDGKTKISDVLIGEVWLCSGQSNMEMPMAGWLPKCPLDNSASEIAAANHPLIRLYKTPRVASSVPKDPIDATWKTCTPDNVKDFSACAYYFGRKLHQDLNVPIGLLESCWGGTRIEPWTPPCGFDGIASLADIRKKINPMPALGKNPRQDRQFPTALYNGMLAAHIPFAIKGAIWYQGESNRNEGMLYVDKTKALLNGWHKLWGYDFPFYFVQIAPYRYGTQDPAVLPEFWEAEAAIVKTIPKTGMAVISDHASLDNIHPPDKKDPGERLALLAEANTYGMDVISTGPTFRKMKKPLFGGNTLKIVFNSAEGLTTRDGKAPDWFEMVGEDGHFKPAKAVIKGNSVILSSPDVKKPVAMRFAWSKLATPNLVNAAGLPAPAFRAGEVPEPKLPDITEIPEMEGFNIAYQLVIPVNCNFAQKAPEYTIDNSDKAGSFKQVAYLLELQKDDKDVQYAFASMDAFTDDIKQIAVPTPSCGARFMQQINNLTVRSNVDGIKEVTGSDGGNIEFWPGNYGPQNNSNIPGASATLWDFGDDGSDKIPGYGCMQIHNWKDQQTVFAFNHWNGGTVDIGIGNSTTDKRTHDWTFSSNGGSYFMRSLTVFVK